MDVVCKNTRHLFWSVKSKGISMLLYNCHCMFNMWYIPAVYSAYCRSVKCKVVPGHALKGCGGSRDIIPLILDLGTRWRWVVKFTPRPLCPPKQTPVSHWTGGWIGPRAGLGDFGEEKNLLPLPDFELRTFRPKGNFNLVLSFFSWSPKQRDTRFICCRKL